MDCCRQPNVAIWRDRTRHDNKSKEEEQALALRDPLQLGHQPRVAAEARAEDVLAVEVPEREADRLRFLARPVPSRGDLLPRNNRRPVDLLLVMRFVKEITVSRH